ncbi:CDP-glucose 4,6-dehydratase [Cohnella phaseoli]|uniref:CDP-glucose 4,6-dehydratase n=1 Tax=Cohnella phaseoli TaxID=456490 RepID=A0A3D9KCW6_9BACL|nr:CDP-glucose 4,6-dehydratase [Cohnella phaseoli]RED83980.1 CDP-glucose 4,6-dehydratase [Cohnella phaseoli]
MGASIWSNKKVLITGHTGFKGSWLTIWLSQMGANVVGYALNPPTTPSLFSLGQVDQLVHSIIGDIRDRENVYQVMNDFDPDIVFHMAAQPLVRESYVNPLETYEINLMGTLNVLESVRQKSKSSYKKRVVINVTSDKCYENKEWVWGYRENESLGGYDPYSNSKACSELATSSYRNSFFHPDKCEEHGVLLASARAGNVIGGGDWAKDRLVPDCVRALLAEEAITIRNPNSIRPWQHVLEPLRGYILLAEKLYSEGSKYADGWNFGPRDYDAKNVQWIVEKLIRMWNKNLTFQIDKNEHPHEAHYLKLDCTKAHQLLGWKPRWNIEIALEKIIDWTYCYKEQGNIRDFTIQQIKDYEMFI